LPLKKVGVAKIAKSGKSLQISYEPLNSLFKHYLFISLDQLKQVLDQKKAEAGVVTVVHENKIDQKFDL